MGTTYFFSVQLPIWPTWWMCPQDISQLPGSGSTWRPTCPGSAMTVIVPVNISKRNACGFFQPYKCLLLSNYWSIVHCSDEVPITSIDNGQWYCPDTTNATIHIRKCYLECYPGNIYCYCTYHNIQNNFEWFVYRILHPNSGYVQEPRHFSECSDQAWNPPLSEMACVEGVALVVGGAHSNRYVEVYGTNVAKALPVLPHGLQCLTLTYLHGDIYACGNNIINGRKCLKGTYANETKGKYNPHDVIGPKMYRDLYVHQFFIFQLLLEVPESNVLSKFSILQSELLKNAFLVHTHCTPLPCLLHRYHTNEHFESTFRHCVDTAQLHDLPQALSFIWGSAWEAVRNGRGHPPQNRWAYGSTVRGWKMVQNIWFEESSVSGKSVKILFCLIKECFRPFWSLISHLAKQCLCQNQIFELTLIKHLSCT